MLCAADGQSESDESGKGPKSAPVRPKSPWAECDRLWNAARFLRSRRAAWFVPRPQGSKTFWVQVDNRSQSRAGSVTLCSLAFTTNPSIASVLLALNILHAVVWNIYSLSLRQRFVSDNLLGRVGAAARVLGLLGLAIGSALGCVLGTVELVITIGLGGLLFVGCCIAAMITLRGQLVSDDPLPIASRD